MHCATDGGTRKAIAVIARPGVLYRLTAASGSGYGDNAAARISPTMACSYFAAS